MTNLDLIVLGAVLILVGAVLTALVWVGARSRTGKKVKTALEVTYEGRSFINSPSAGVIVVATGGRLISLTPRARELFQLNNQHPNLEQLALRCDPQTIFYELCAREGEAFFNLNGDPVSGESFQITSSGPARMLITIRRLVLTAPGEQTSPDRVTGTAPTMPGAQIAQLVSELDRGIISNLDRLAVSEAILIAITRLIMADHFQLNIWETEARRLVPYVLSRPEGKPPHVLRRETPIPPDEPLTAELIRTRHPLHITPGEQPVFQRALQKRIELPLQHYLGLALFRENEFAGTVELMATQAESFGPAAIDTLHLLSGTAAAAIYNCIAFEKLQRHAREMTTLAEITRSVSSGADLENLFTGLLESLRKLLPVQVSGFFLLDSERRMLQGQAPFHGLPSGILEWAQTPVSPESAAEVLLNAGELIYASDAPNDPRVRAFDLHHLSQAAGIRHAVLAPLISGGRAFGLLFIANKPEHAPFDGRDLQLLENISRYLSPIIENAVLIQVVRRRAQRSESLRRITNLTSSAATRDEILKYSIQDLARLLHADVAAIFLLEEARGELRAHTPSLFGVPDSTGRRLGRISIDEPQFHATVTGSQHPFISSNLPEDRRVLPLYRPLITNLQLESALAAPLISQDRSLGEILIGCRQPAAFDQADLQTVITAAGQLAGALQQRVLATQTDENLRRQISHLAALNRLSRELTGTLDPKQLLERIYAEALEISDADCGIAFLYVTDLVWGAPDSVLLSEPMIGSQVGDALTPAIQWLDARVFENRAPLLITDCRNVDYRALFPIGEGVEPAAPHPGATSLIVLPLIAQEEILGCLHLHGEQPGQFDEITLEAVEALAAQASLALLNAQRYQQEVQQRDRLNQRLYTLSKLFESWQNLRQDQPFEQTLEGLAYAIQAVTPFEKVLIHVGKTDGEHLHCLAGAGVTRAEFEQYAHQPLTWITLTHRFTQAARYGRLYQAPLYEQAPTVSNSVHAAEAVPLRYYLPLADSQNVQLGVIEVSAEETLVPDASVLETLELFAIQTGFIIKSHLRYQDLETAFNTLAQQSAQTRLSLEAANEQLPLLVAQTANIENLSRQNSRLQAGLDIAELVNRQGDRIGVLQTLAQELYVSFGLDGALVVEPSPGGPRLLHEAGDFPEEINLDTLLGQRNPLKFSLANGTQLLVADISTSGEWVGSPLLQNLKAAAFICLPILSGSQVEAAVLAVGESPQAAFTAEDERLFAYLARQVAVTLQNLNLLTETSNRLAEVNLLLDFNRQLGSLEPNRILQTLVESVRFIVPAADACLVATWEISQGQLITRAAAGYRDYDSLLAITYAPGEALAGKVYQLGGAERIDEVDFAQVYNLSSEKLVLYRDATGGRLPVSAMGLPLQRTLGTAPLGVIILENFQQDAAFHTETQALVASLTQQTALNLENSQLYQSAAERAQQLQALTEVAGLITASLEPEQLIDSLLEYLKRILPYQTGTLWLRFGEQATVKAAHGFADDEQRIGISASIQDSTLLKAMLESHAPLIVADTHQDARFPRLVEDTHRSWLGLPLVAAQEMVGVIALERAAANAFTSEDVQLATTFTSQAAVALENARLFQQSVARTEELDQRTQRLELLFRLSSALSESLEPERLLEIALQEITNALGAGSAFAVSFTAEGTSLITAEHPPREAGRPEFLPATPLFDRLQQTLGIFNTSDGLAEPELEPLWPYLDGLGGRGLLALSLATGSELHGVLLVLSPNVHRFSPDEVGLARTISNQTAIAFQNARLYAETRDLSEALERRVQARTLELAREHQRTETLLRIITELSASLDLEQVLNRTLDVLNQIVDAEQITVLIARPGADKLHLLASAGLFQARPTDGYITSLNPDEGLAGWAIQEQTPALISDVRHDPRWVSLPGTASAEYRSAICVPLLIGAESLGALLFLHRRVEHFSTDQLDLVQAAANQVAVAVNNAELYRLIRDQAEDLGVMVRTQQVETQRTKAILEDVADGVLVTDAEMHITLFNDSAEHILDLSRQQVLGRTLEQFSGLFGNAAHSWMETIRRWSRSTSSYHSGDTFAERIDLDNGRVVSVHLAPVSLRNTFLGTVSIFRDITHQVEVDRLKSEFVATVSHELRTPMTSIKGYVDVMLMGAAGEVTGPQRQFLDVVKQNTARLEILVNDLLDVSRIEAGRATLSLGPVNLVELTPDVVDQVRARAQTEEKPMSIEVDFPANLSPVLGDRQRLHQILLNLVENAYQYTPAGGTIVVHAFERTDEIEIHIQDNGIGIPVELQPRVFERFYRGEHPFVLATSGTGLGLAIVKQLVEMHQGQIWLNSTGVPGEGSDFTFTIPVYSIDR